MLFHTVFLYGSQNHSCADLFIEVNARQSRFCQSMLDFSPRGRNLIERSLAVARGDVALRWMLNRTTR
jgi:hypothetical protein